MKKIISKILIIFILIIMLFEFTFSSNICNAAIDVEKTVNSIANLAGGIVSIIYWPKRILATGIAFILDMIVANLAQTEGVNYGKGTPITIITPYEIFFNKYKLLDINFFDFKNVESGSMVYTIRTSVATWFYTMRIIASAILLVVLIYVGIRMALSTIAEDKAKYKRMLFDWVCSLALIFVLQYIAIFTIYCNNAIVNALKSAMTDLSSVEDQIGNILLDIGLKAVAGIGITSIAAVLVFCFIVFQTIAFLIAYISRMIKVGFLIIISPLISLTYSIDKMGDGKAQALGNWLKEYVYTILIQPFHCVMYMAFVRTALTLLVDTSAVKVLGIPLLESAEYNQLANGVLAILCLKFINDGEKIVRKIFGFQDDNSSTSLAAGLAVGMVALNSAKKIGTTTRKGINSISKATGKYGTRMQNAISKMSPRNPIAVGNKLAGKLGDGMKAIKGAPSKTKNTLGKKFKSTKVGGKLSKFANTERGKKLASAGKNIKGFMKNRNSLASTLGLMAAAAAYSTGSTNVLTAVGIGAGVSKGAGELYGSSKKALSEEDRNNNEVEDQKLFDKTIGAEMKKTEKNMAALENPKYKDIVGKYKAADTHEANAKAARDRAEAKRKEMENRPKGKDKGKYEKQIRQDELKAEKEEAKAKALRDAAEAMEDGKVIKEMYDEGKLTSDGSILDPEEVKANEQANLEKLYEQKNEFFSEDKVKERILQRKNLGSTTSELNAKKNKLIQKLTALKLEAKQRKSQDSSANNTLTIDETDSIERTAEALMNNISAGVLAGKGYNSLNETEHLNTIRNSLGLNDDLNAFSSYSGVMDALSDFDSAKRNQRTAEIFNYNSSLNGTDDSLATKEARKISAKNSTY